MINFYKYLIAILMFLILFIVGCSQVPDKVYHPPCPNENNCSDEELKCAIKYRKDIFIGKTGFNACILKNKIFSVENIDKYTYCDENQSKEKIQTPYYEAWLEYDESGIKHDKNQKKAILQKIKSIKKPLLVVIYMNGWHHSADTSDGNPRNNAVKFPFLMARSVDTLKRLELANQIREHEVLGIYVGWSGKKYKNDFSDIFTIGDRSKVADKIGRGELKKDLQDIAKELYKNGDTNRHMMVLGHSLGGRMLTSAFKSDLDCITSKEKLDFNTSAPLGKNSLIVTINPAVGDSCYDSVFKYAGCNPQMSRPYWINMTSKDDTATGWIYNLSRWLGIVESCGKEIEWKDKTIGHNSGYLRQVIYKSKHNTTKLYKDSKNYFTKEYHAYEMDWFLEATKEDRTIKLGFPNRKIKEMNPEVRYYSFSFKLAGDKVPKEALTRKVWNVETDESFINFGDLNGSSSLSSTHSGYISTVLMRLFTELLFYEPKKSEVKGLK